MKTPRLVAWLLGAAVILTHPARATDLIVDGNTIVTGKIGIGLATNAVPAQALEILNGSIALKQITSSSSIRFENGSVGNAGFIIAYRNGYDDFLIKPLVQATSYWPEHTVWMTNSGYLGVGGTAHGRLGVHQRPSDAYAFSINTTWSTVQPTFGWFKNNQIAFNQRLATTSLNQFQFNISPAIGQTPVTALEIHPSTNVLVGGNLVPQAKLHVLGNIIAADPTAATHVVTKQWAESLVQTSLTHLEPQGDISMGEFTAEP